MSAEIQGYIIAGGVIADRWTAIWADQWIGEAAGGKRWRDRNDARPTGLIS